MRIKQQIGVFFSKFAGGIGLRLQKRVFATRADWLLRKITPIGRLSILINPALRSLEKRPLVATQFVAPCQLVA